LVDADVLVRDYLDRLGAAAASLPAGRRTELAAEVRDHIDAGLAEAGRADEVTVRNILERLGSPEEIVAAEGGPPTGPEPGPTTAVRVGWSARADSHWGALEGAAALVLGLAWPALLLPYGRLWWLGLGVGGLVLVWASGTWTSRQKVLISTVVVVLYAIAILLTTPISVQCTTGTPLQACPPGGPSPVVTSS
jgi:hypothetical protein